jgi:RimJ/RimL family protein N-acetyltransferase
MVLTTDRLLLRPVEDGDLDAWAAFLGDAEATRLVHFPDPRDRQFAEELLRRTIARARGAEAMYAVIVRDTGQTAGFVGYSRRELEWGDERELGWLLLPPFHGNGYATEAARVVRQLVPGRVVSLIRKENAASINVARKLGMDLERDIDFVGFPTHVYVSESVAV